MKPGNDEATRRPRNTQGEAPNWILIAGSALLSTLSVRIGYKLKQVLDAKQTCKRSQSLKVDGKPNLGKKSGSFHLHSNGFCFPQEEDGNYNGFTASRHVVEIKQEHSSQIVTEPEMALPLVTVPTIELNKENDATWSSSPDRKPFHHSNSSDSPCVSETSSDIFSKREVIQKLRQQLKRRDDMILEMQDQITELQASLSTQQLHSSHLQSLVDAANRDLFDSEREIQRLRKAIADHCVGHAANSVEKPPIVPVWPVNGKNAYTKNGYPSFDGNYEASDNKGEKIEMLRREVVELKELNEAKDYLLRSYKEQKSELSLKIEELQQRLDSQLPNIL